MLIGPIVLMQHTGLGLALLAVLLLAVGVVRLLAAVRVQRGCADARRFDALVLVAESAVSAGRRQ